MEEERLPKAVEALFQFISLYGEYFEFVEYLKPILLTAAGALVLGSLYTIIAKRVLMPKWMESSAVVAGFISIPYCLAHLFGAAFAFVLETSVGGFYGPGTSPQVYFIPSVLIDIFPITGLAYLVRTVRTSELLLMVLSLVFLIYEPLLRWIADAS